MDKNLALYFNRRILIILFLGFASGLPLLLVLSTLSFWLKSSGVAITTIGLFSLVRTPYGLKFLWSPLIDQVKIPYLTKIMGRRRSWIMVTQIFLMSAILALARTDPASNPMLTAVLALLVAFGSASQDIVIDAYRIESLQADEQGAGSAMIVLGYRMAMLFSGAGALWLAAKLSWQNVYTLMGLMVMVGMITIISAPEPKYDEQIKPQNHFFKETILAPLKDFMQRPSAFLILLFIMFYKLCDAYLGPVASPFYIEMGFSKEEIAGIIQVYGMGATIIGGLIGGILVKKYGLVQSLFLGGILQALSNFMYVAQAAMGYDPDFLILTISIENLSGGIGTIALVAYLSSLCSMAYTATQYALLSSLMALARDVIASSSGYMVAFLGWSYFFMITSLMAIPGLLILGLIIKRK